MAHAIWSGSINFGLVTIPVKLFTAVRGNDLSFNMLHAKDEGYEYEKGDYVILTDEDFKKVNPEATQSVDILEFVELDKINPMYFDKPYYLEPTKQGRHAYALLREALEKANKVAIARVVIRTKETIAAVKPSGDALVLEIMHWADEMIEESTLDLPGETKLPEPEMKMAKMLIDAMSVDEFEPEKFTNAYHEELLAMIEARAAGKELPKPKKAPARPKVVNIMDVLAQSVEASKKQRGARTAAAEKRAAHKAAPKRRKSA